MGFLKQGYKGDARAGFKTFLGREQFGVRTQDAQAKLGLNNFNPFGIG